MLSDVKTSTKLLFGFGLAIVVTLIIGIVGRQSMLSLEGQVDELGKGRLPSVQGLHEMVAGQLRVVIGERGMVNARMLEHKDRQGAYDEVAAGFRQAEEGKRILEPVVKSSDEQRAWSSFQPRWDEWQRGIQSIVDIEKEKDNLLSGGAKPDDPRIVQIDNRAQVIRHDIHDARADSAKILEDLARLNIESTKTSVAESEASSSKSISFMLIMMLLGSAIAAAAGILIARSLSSGVSLLRKESARLAEAAVSGQLTTRADTMAVPAEFRGIVQGVNDTLDAVINPLNVAAEYVEKISNGNIPPKITDNYNGDFNIIKSNLNQLVSNLNQLSDDMAVMSKQHDAGDIDVKIPEERLEGAYRVMAKGVNDMVFGHIAVKKKAMACIAEFGKGNFDAELEKFPGKKVFINENIERLRTNIKSFVHDMAHMSREHDAGDIDIRIPEEKFEGGYRVMAKGVNDMVFGHIAVKKKAMACLAEFSRGNFDAELEKFPGKKVFINENIERLRGNIKSFMHDMAHMSKEHDAGDIDIRIPEDKFEGGYRVMAKGVNDMVFGHIAVKKKAMACLAEFAAGNFDAPLEKFPGKKVFINDNIELLRRNSKALIADANVLSKAAVEGKLATRADASKHQGDFRKIVQGVNDTLDAVIGPLNVSADYVNKISRGNIPERITDTYNGDFNTIKNNLNKCIDAVNKMSGDATMLAKAAVEGKLATRADATKHEGDFRKIVQGVNETLDAVIGPLNVSADYVDKISRGNIPPKITDSYNGDFNTIKNNLNRCVDAVNSLVADTETLVRASIEGKLSTRADASKHEGDYRRIVDGVNKTLDAVIAPVMEAAGALETLARYDLRARVTGDYQGDHARIKDALNGTAKALQDALSQVADAVEQVSEASQQIAGSSQAVSQGASEQASSLEETSSSLEEMAGMTKQNADNTIQARSLAQTTKEAAEKGGTAMVRMTDAMEKIRAASQGTADIIKDINEIAFQTNLLALNAAVEAARAGDAGRGFAVVAEEVRNLALRSKEAAKKTEDLIKVAVGHAENGRVITNEVAGSLTEIVTAAAKVNDIVSEIAVASQEQSRGIEQVNTAVAEMDKVVQTAASNAEESSSAAEELASQSEELSSLVQRFELDRDNRTAARRHAPAAKELVAPRRAAMHPATIPPPRRGAVNVNRSKKPNGSNGNSHKPTPEDSDPTRKGPGISRLLVSQNQREPRGRPKKSEVAHGPCRDCDA